VLDRTDATSRESFVDRSGRCAVWRSERRNSLEGSSVCAGHIDEFDGVATHLVGVQKYSPGGTCRGEGRETQAVRART